MASASAAAAEAEALDDEEVRQLDAAKTLSVQLMQSRHAATRLPSAEPIADAQRLATIVFGEASAVVVGQWMQQGVALAPPASISAGPGCEPLGVGLAQEQGGPCAVLAATQGMLLRRLLSGQSPLQLLPAAAEPVAAEAAALSPSKAEAAELLIAALADILWRAASAEPAVTSEAGSSSCIRAVVALPLPPAGPPPAAAASVADLQGLFVRMLQTAAVAYSWDETRVALEERAEALASPIGAICVLCSALLSRGIDRFNSERDDASNPLIDAQFGHCSQEVLNLMLVGQGVSNVFDGERDLGSGFMLRGVKARPPVGLLSELEALRYLQVGTLYKQPAFPIWVIASQSHYSVLFSLSPEAQRSSQLEALEEQLLRAFSEYDSEGNGFISAEHLPSLITALPEWRTPPADEMRSRVDPEATSLVIWDRFLQAMLPLHPGSESAMLANIEAQAEASAKQPISLFHYNGLASAGHAHKRALRRVTVKPGAARGQPLPEPSLAAVLQTRWKDAAVDWEGTAPSIN